MGVVYLRLARTWGSRNLMEESHSGYVESCTVGIEKSRAFGVGIGFGFGVGVKAGADHAGQAGPWWDPAPQKGGRRGIRHTGGTPPGDELGAATQAGIRDRGIAVRPLPGKGADSGRHRRPSRHPDDPATLGPPMSGEHNTAFGTKRWGHPGIESSTALCIDSCAVIGS
jgi:hypothetical protein